MKNKTIDKNKQIVSIMDIAGKDENAITKAFAVIVRKDKTLLNYLINRVSLAANKKPIKVDNNTFKATTFELEHHIYKGKSKGRTDIKIQNDKVALYVESKIKTNEVTYEQANKYSQELNRSKSKLKLFAFICEVGNMNIDQRLTNKYPNIGYAILSWADTLELVIKRGVIKVNLVEEYKQYIKEKRNMKIHDIDIWAVVAKGKQEKNFNNGIYIHSSKHSPILIGRREWDEKLNKSVVKELRPVLEVMDEISAKKIGFNIIKLGGTKEDYLYILGGKLKLVNPLLPKNGKFSQTSAISLPFSELKLR